MIFYGKAQRRVAVAAALDAVEGAIAEALSAAPPIVRHAAWVSALVEAGGLAQGLADASGGDPISPRGQEGVGSDGGGPADRAMALCLALAAVMGRSWDSAFVDLPDAVPDAVADALARLGASPGLPEAVEIRRTEGFAHYAVYPEAHWRAAEGLTRRRPTRVLGLRSIGDDAGGGGRGGARGSAAPHRPAARAPVRARGRDRPPARRGREAPRSGRSSTRGRGCRAPRWAPPPMP